MINVLLYVSVSVCFGMQVIVEWFVYNKCGFNNNFKNQNTYRTVGVKLTKIIIINNQQIKVKLETPN